VNRLTLLEARVKDGVGGGVVAEICGPGDETLVRGSDGLKEEGGREGGREGSG